jgi:hypothetical protein
MSGIVAFQMKAIEEILGVRLEHGRNTSFDDFVLTPRQGRLLVTASSPKFRRLNHATKHSRRDQAGDVKVQQYRRQMLAGDFHCASTIQLAYVVGDHNTIYLTNGDHRLTALGGIEDEAFGGQGFIVQVRSCQSEGDVEDLVECHDTGDNGRKQHQVDIMRGKLERLNLTEQELKVLNGALTFVWSAFMPSTKMRCKVSPSLHDMSQEDWTPHFKAYMEAVGLVSTANTPIMKQVRGKLRATTMTAVGMTTLRSRPEEAADFWHRVANHTDQSDHTDPATKMVNFLVTQSSLRREAFVRAAARIWNLEIGNSKIKSQVRVTNTSGDVPILIAGTPYDGQFHLAYSPINIGLEHVVQHRSAKTRILLPDQFESYRAMDRQEIALRARRGRGAR